MFKNIASQKLPVFAWDSANGVPKTGDAANITAQISIDGGVTAATDDVNPTELDAADAPGVYIFDLTQAETNGDLIIVAAVSATADIDIEPVLVYTIDNERTADVVWDEILTGATHNVPTSAGRRLRGIQEFQGYENGAIWLDSVNGSAGTTDFENGTVENPVDTVADAVTLATSLGITRFEIAAGSTFTLAQSVEGFVVNGSRWTLALGIQSIANSTIIGADVSGVCTGATPRFSRCMMGNVTLPPCIVEACGWMGTVTIGSAGDFFFDQCYSNIAGVATPSLEWNAVIGTTNVSVRHYSGGIELKNMGKAGTDTMSLEGFGQCIINVNCTGGTLAIRGNIEITDNASGAVTLSDEARMSFDKSSLTAGGSATLTNILAAIYAMARGKITVSGNVLTVLDDDDSTTLFTLTLSDSQRGTS